MLILIVFLSSLALSAAPILPTPDVTDGSLSLAVEDIGTSGLFNLVLTRGSVSERYAFHNLDIIRNVAVGGSRAVIFGALTADAVGPIALTFGAGGCAPGACYSNLHSYSWLPWQANQIVYPTGYTTYPLSTGGGLRFTDFTSAGVLSAMISARRENQSLAGPEYIEFAYSWDLGGSTNSPLNHMPEPSSIYLVALGAVAVSLTRVWRNYPVRG